MDISPESRPRNGLQKIGYNIFASISKHKSSLYLFVSTLTHFHVAGVKQAFKATLAQNAEACVIGMIFYDYYRFMISILYKIYLK